MNQVHARAAAPAGVPGRTPTAPRRRSDSWPWATTELVFGRTRRPAAASGASPTFWNGWSLTTRFASSCRWVNAEAIRRGAFPSVRDLTTEIRTFINGWNRRKHPVIWTKTPDEILTKLNRKKTSAPSH